MTKSARNTGMTSLSAWPTDDTRILSPIGRCEAIGIRVVAWIFGILNGMQFRIVPGMEPESPRLNGESSRQRENKI